MGAKVGAAFYALCRRLLSRAYLTLPSQDGTFTHEEVLAQRVPATGSSGLVAGMWIDGQGESVTTRNAVLSFCRPKGRASQSRQPMDASGRQVGLFRL